MPNVVISTHCGLSEGHGRKGGNEDVGDIVRLGSNPYHADSVANPYGRYGNPYSPDSIDNQYGLGNPYSGNQLFAVPDDD
jgi:hypothetical protein